MDIIPEDEELVIEAQVKPHVIDRVKVLDIVDIRFSSFSKSPMLVLEGKVNSISADILYGQKGAILSCTNQHHGKWTGEISWAKNATRYAGTGNYKDRNPYLAVLHSPSINTEIGLINDRGIGKKMKKNIIFTSFLGILFAET